MSDQQLEQNVRELSAEETLRLKEIEKLKTLEWRILKADMLRTELISAAKAEAKRFVLATEQGTSRSLGDIVAAMQLNTNDKREQMKNLKTQDAKAFVTKLTEIVDKQENFAVEKKPVLKAANASVKPYMTKAQLIQTMTDDAKKDTEKRNNELGFRVVPDVDPAIWAYGTRKATQV